MSEVTVTCVIGHAIEPHLDAAAALRIEVFREYPYLYDGDAAYERDYLRTYLSSDHAIFVLATAGSQVVGVSTGLPLAAEEQAFQQPFVQRGIDPATVFYFGESVLKKPYRGLGVGHRFFDHREAHAASLPNITTCAFCAVDRPSDHPMKPSDHQPLDAFWRKRGYTKQPDLKASYSWKQIDEAEESPKTLTFWLREIQASA